MARVEFALEAREAISHRAVKGGLLRTAAKVCPGREQAWRCPATRLLADLTALCVSEVRRRARRLRMEYGAPLAARPCRSPTPPDRNLPNELTILRSRAAVGALSWGLAVAAAIPLCTGTGVPLWVLLLWAATHLPPILIFVGRASGSLWAPSCVALDACLLAASQSFLVPAPVVLFMHICMVFAWRDEERARERGVVA